MTRRLTNEQYERLLTFRTGLRTFLRWSESQAAAAGLTSAQHQLLLAVRCLHAAVPGPTVGELAEVLLLRHNSVVGLLDRCERAGLVRRIGDDADQRVVRVALTAQGADRLEQLSAAHLEELARLGPRFGALWDGLPPA